MGNVFGEGRDGIIKLELGKALNSYINYSKAKGLNVELMSKERNGKPGKGTHLLF